MIEFIQAAGLEVTITKDACTEDDSWVTTVPPGFWCGVMAQGSIATINSGQGRHQWSEQSESSICNVWFKDPIETEHVVMQSGPLSAVFVRIAPEHLEPLLGDGAQAMTTSHTHFSTNPYKRSIINAMAWQMLGCPLTGSARKLYLTGKAMEFVSLLLNDNQEKYCLPDLTNSSGSIPSQEIRRLHDARTILLERLDNPPTVTELSRMVGLNSRKLGEGFKELFGFSVYAFVKNRRLELAHLLLENGDTTVAQAAYACGYQPSHFSTEFRRRFGVPPSVLTAGRKKPI